MSYIITNIYNHQKIFSDEGIEFTSSKIKHAGIMDIRIFERSFLYIIDTHMFEAAIVSWIPTCLKLSLCHGYPHVWSFHYMMDTNMFEASIVSWIPTCLKLSLYDGYPHVWSFHRIMDTHMFEAFIVWWIPACLKLSLYHGHECCRNVSLKIHRQIYFVLRNTLKNVVIICSPSEVGARIENKTV